MALMGPTSEVDICNLALQRLKQVAITSIDPPDTNAEQICANAYPQVRRAILRSHPWNFALKRDTINASATAPAFGFQLAYTLPPDFLRFVERVDSEGNIITDDQYVIENHQLLTDGETTDSLYLVYVFDQEDISRYDPLFIEFFALTLAVHISQHFSATANRVQILEEQRRLAGIEARAVDGQERPPKRIETSNWLQARRTRPSVAGKFIRFG